MVKIATVSMQVEWNKEKNLQKYMTYIDQAAANGVKLIVFPEQSLQGYLTNTIALDFSNVAYQFDQAEVVPEGPSVQKLIRVAAEKDIYIVFGMTEREKDRPHVLYNSAVLVGPEGYVGTYRKVHQPGDEKHVYYPGNEFKVFSTAIGKIGLLICYDKIFPESTRELALKGADLLIMPTAWALECSDHPDSEDAMGQYYDLFDYVRALENQCWFISSNMWGKLGTLDYYGHSRIVDPMGKTVSDSGFKEGIAYAEIDVRQRIVQARSVGYIGYNFLKDYRPVVLDS